MTARALVAFSGLDAPHQAAVRHVYESSFPLALRAPWDEITANRPDERLLVLLEAGRPIGFALVRHLGDTSMSFIRYFVVDAKRRGGGYGSALLSALVDHLRQAERSMLLLDVEDPDGRADDSPERRDDLRRIEFYRRHGVGLLAVRDYAPPDHGQEGEEPRLLLMGACLGELGGDVVGPALREAVMAVYRHRYGLDPDDPVVRNTLRASGL
jgi:GNAT superfamily N-acetyltransferase